MSLFSHVVVRFVNVSWGGMLLWVLLFCVFWCSLDRFCFFLKLNLSWGTLELWACAGLVCGRLGLGGWASLGVFWRSWSRLMYAVNS